MLKKIIVLFFMLAMFTGVFASQPKRSLMENVALLVRYYQYQCDPSENKKFQLDLAILRQKVLMATISKQIAVNPQRAYSLIRKKLFAAKHDYVALTVYVWALGKTKLFSAVKDIIQIANKHKGKNIADKQPLMLDFSISDCVRSAISSLKSKEGVRYLHQEIYHKIDASFRYGILMTFAQRKYVDAVPLTIDILQMPRAGWRNIFLFGTYGDLATPFLLKNLGHKNNVVRRNVAYILGYITLADRALPFLKKQLWKEADHQVGTMLLRMIFSLSTDHKKLAQFYREFGAQGKNRFLSDKALRYLVYVPKAHKQVEKFIKMKKVDRAVFVQEYKKLFASYGKKGSLKTLLISSSYADEKKLFKLRSRILLRSSDECLRAVDRVSKIIMWNRYIHFFKK